MIPIQQNFTKIFSLLNVLLIDLKLLSSACICMCDLIVD